VYTDLNFVNAFEQNGIDASSAVIAEHWSNTAYHLAHANQASRYNILNGILPPASGNWKNNPHADDIDFQIESDFIGLMAPGMVNQATEIADRVGHVMNSGDGWYGGVFVSAMYSLAFVSSDPVYIVEEAIKTIPEGTTFHECISDVIKWKKEYPNDWKRNWFELQKKWNYDLGCPKGVSLGFNIEAKINSAYVAIGLLYGDGDYSKSIDIAARCGQDADCNPGTAGGVIGVMLGYNNIPEFWLNPLQEIEEDKFENTTYSLSQAYDWSLSHAMQMIERSGGEVTETNVTIPLEEPRAVAYEQNFENINSAERIKIDKSLPIELTLALAAMDFCFMVIWLNVPKLMSHILIGFRNGPTVLSHLDWLEPDDPYVALMDIVLDGEIVETVKLPMKNSARRLEPALEVRFTGRRSYFRVDLEKS
jgi:hypothetical protein